MRFKNEANGCNSNVINRIHTPSITAYIEKLLEADPMVPDDRLLDVHPEATNIPVGAVLYTKAHVYRKSEEEGKRSEEVTMKRSIRLLEDENGHREVSIGIEESDQNPAEFRVSFDSLGRVRNIYVQECTIGKQDWRECLSVSADKAIQDPEMIRRVNAYLHHVVNFQIEAALDGQSASRIAFDLRVAGHRHAIARRYLTMLIAYFAVMSVLILVGAPIVAAATSFFLAVLLLLDSSTLAKTSISTKKPVTNAHPGRTCSVRLIPEKPSEGEDE